MAYLLNYLALTFLVFCSAENVTVKETNNGNCPPFWTQFQNNCYRFYGRRMSWTDAEQHCRETISCNGDATAHLVSIHNQDENSFVYAYWQSSLMEECTNRNDSLWIGMSTADEMRGHENSMVWSDGTSKDYTNFSPWQPDDYNDNEDCVEMWQRDSIIGDTWNDCPCRGWMPFICKMPTD